MATVLTVFVRPGSQHVDLERAKTLSLFVGYKTHTKAQMKRISPSLNLNLDLNLPCLLNGKPF